MASGKSSVGGLLAELTGADFTDMDAVIENREGIPIHGIFSQKGEEYFRRIESVLLHELGETCTHTKRVIATGGGLPCTDDNMDYMNEVGVTVYINSTIDDIVSRVTNSRDRPVFHRTGTRKGLRELLRTREPFYRRAFVTVENSNGMSVELVAERIARTLGL
jgi:shikimate kinase